MNITLIGGPRDGETVPVPTPDHDSAPDTVTVGAHYYLPTHEDPDRGWVAVYGGHASPTPEGSSDPAYRAAQNRWASNSPDLDRAPAKSDTP